MVIIRKRGKKFSLVKNGKQLTPFIFDSIDPFYEGYAIARIKRFGDYIYTEDGKVALKQPFDCVRRYGLSDQGDVIADTVYYTITHKGCTCILDEMLNMCAPWGDYESCQCQSNGTWVVRDRMCNYGFVGKGRIITPCIYENYRSFHDGFAMVRWRNKKWGMIDSSGNLVIPDIYDSLDHSVSEGLVCAEKDGKFGYLDTNGRIAIPFNFSSGDMFRNGQACVVTLDGQHRTIDHTGQFIDELNECKIPAELLSKNVSPTLARKIADNREKTRKWFNNLQDKEFITTKKTTIEYLIHYAAPYTGAGEDKVQKGTILKLRQKMRDDAWYCSIVNGDDEFRINKKECTIAGKRNPRLAGRCTGISIFLTEIQLTKKDFKLLSKPKKRTSPL